MRLVGVAILAAVAAVLFGATAHLMGWRLALLLWVAALAVTGLIVLGVYLVTA